MEIKEQITYRKSLHRNWSTENEETQTVLDGTGPESAAQPLPTVTMALPPPLLVATLTKYKKEHIIAAFRGRIPKLKKFTSTPNPNPKFPYGLKPKIKFALSLWAKASIVVYIIPPLFRLKESAKPICKVRGVNELILSELSLFEFGSFKFYTSSRLRTNQKIEPELELIISRSSSQAGSYI
jgi:hypothetical protein